MWIRCTLALALLLLPSLVAGQKSAATVKQTKPQLTPKQKNGRRMLRNSEVAARGYSAEMRAVLLLEISAAYHTLDPSRRRKLLNESFRASTEIDGRVNKREVQWEILTELLHSWPADVEPLLPATDEKYRPLITGELASAYAEKKDFDRALRLLNAAAAEGDYPYRAAAEIMVQLPAERAAERLDVFCSALNAYRQQQDTFPGFEDMATLVVRFWQKLPAALVLQSIDEILAKSREGAEAKHYNLSLLGSEGKAHTVAAHFDSIYEYRLFELLPILRALDPDRADSLLHSNQNVRQMLSDYPQALQSLDPAVRDTPLGKGEHRAVTGITGAPPSEVAMRRRSALRRDQITKLANVDPSQAYEVAMTLQPAAAGAPNWPRAEAMGIVAAAAMKRDPSLAVKATKEQRSILLTMQPFLVLSKLKDVYETFMQLGDSDAALETAQEAMKLAEKSYKRDSDSTDPNLALKAMWPSTEIWREFISLLADTNPEMAQRLLKDIPDPEIATCVEVAIGSWLLSGMAYELSLPSEPRYK
ncbi:MAG TPA: hypothetical protein VK473_14380, partial [Terriglobales bacterium]|nr:hypothetical protein [Terriglobales bacterium]